MSTANKQISKAATFTATDMLKYLNTEHELRLKPQLKMKKKLLL